MGDAAVMFIPGELFVEIGLKIKGLSPFAGTLVAGYARDMVGYLPTDRAFEEGGYELGPGIRARVWRGTEGRLTAAAQRMLAGLRT